MHTCVHIGELDDVHVWGGRTFRCMGDLTVRFTDIDWREVLNEWSEEDLLYLEHIISEKLHAIAHSRAAGYS